MLPSDQRKAALLTGSSLAILLLAADIHNYTCHSASPTSHFHHCGVLRGSVLGPFFTLCQFCMLWTQTSPRNEESLLKHTRHFTFLLTAPFSPSPSPRPRPIISQQSSQGALCSALPPEPWTPGRQSPNLFPLYFPRGWHHVNIWWVLRQ